MIPMLDSALPPSPAQRHVAVRGGWKAWAGYLDSPTAYHPWGDAELIATARDLPLLPVCVGPYPHKGQTVKQALEVASPGRLAENAVAQIARIGRQLNMTELRDLIVAYDLEAKVYEGEPTLALENIEAFARQADRHGIAVAVYSSPACLRALHAHLANTHASNIVWGAWVGEWLTNPPTEHPPTLDDPAGMGNLWAGQRAWQYRGGHDLDGLSVDSSIVDPKFFGRLLRHMPAPRPAPAPAPAPAHPAEATVTVVVDGHTYSGTIPERK